MEAMPMELVMAVQLQWKADHFAFSCCNMMQLFHVGVQASGVLHLLCTQCSTMPCEEQVLNFCYFERDWIRANPQEYNCSAWKNAWIRR